MAMFAFFENFPATGLIQGIAVVIVAIFFATSSDSASLVVDMLCTGDSDSGPVRQRIFWGVSEGMLAALLIIVAGDVGLDALQQVITVVGLPIFILVFASLFALWAGLRSENLPKYVVPPPAVVTSDEETAPSSAGDAEKRETAVT